MSDTPSSAHQAQSSVARSLRWPLQVLRALCLLALCSMISLLVVVTLCTFLNPLGAGDEQTSRTAVRVVVIAGLLLPLLLMWLAYRLRLRSWWWIGGGSLVLLPVLAYLAADEATVRRPTGIEEFAPSFPGAEVSYELFNRYSSAEGRTFAEVLGPGPQLLPKDKSTWAAAFTAQRAALQANWNHLAPLRAWYAELNSHARIGDLGRAAVDSPVPSWLIHRALAVAHVQQAALLALDGQGDAAIDMLIPVFEVNRKLMVHSRSLQRALVGMAARDLALDGVYFVLQHASTSPASRARLATALGQPFGEPGARRLVAIEYAYWSSEAIITYNLDEYDGPAVVRPFLRVITTVFLNPNRTINQMGDYIAEVQERAARRQPLHTTLDPVVRGERLSVKNFFGQLMMSNSTPAYDRVVNTYWKQEDRLAALRARLAAV